MATQNKAAKRALEREAIEHLKEHTGIKPGTQLFTMVAYRSRSGMARHLRVFMIDGDDIREISSLVARATGSRETRDCHVYVGGCGFSAAHHVLDALSSALFGHDAPKPTGIYCNAGVLRYREL